MFGRTVTIDRKEYFVFCTPNEAYSEILRRAMWQAEKEEKREAAERAKSYRAAIDHLSGYPERS